MSFVSKWEVIVRWAECDPAGIVYYPQFFRWFDGAAWAYFQNGGLPMEDMMREFDSFGMPLVDAHCTFRTPARWGDTLTFSTRVVRWGHKSFEMEHKAHIGERLVAEGTEVHVWGVRDPEDRNRLRAGPIPEFVKEHFRKLDAESDG